MSKLYQDTVHLHISADQEHKSGNADTVEQKQVSMLTEINASPNSGRCLRTVCFSTTQLDMGVPEAGPPAQSQRHPLTSCVTFATPRLCAPASPSAKLG